MLSVGQNLSLSILLFIYLLNFWLRWVFVAVHGLLIAVASLVAEHGLLIAVASLVAEHGL